LKSRPGFHEGATIFGHYPGGVMANPIQALFDWIDKPVLRDWGAPFVDY
jgi:hypothetical protein